MTEHPPIHHPFHGKDPRLKEFCSPLVYQRTLLRHQPDENFISTFDSAIPPKTCKKIIELFEEKELDGEVYPGVLGGATKGKGTENQGLKYSRDWQLFSLDPEHEDAYLIEILLDTLSMCVSQYIDRHPGLIAYQEMFWSSLQIQKYSAKEGMYYGVPHVEASAAHFSNRVIAGMIFLNTLDSGATVFPGQKTKILPKEGTVVLFPTGYTHLHWGERADEDKYIITSWLEFVETEE